MNTDELPTISNFAYTSNAVGPDAWATTSAGPVMMVATAFPQPAEPLEEFPQIARGMREKKQFAALTADALADWNETQTESEIMATQRRIVKVLIADTNENVPLESAILFKGDEIFTDLNDQELFFETPVKELLAAHNEKRLKWLDKDATKRAGKDIFLEPIKVRDLRMVVVAIATF